MDAVDRGRRALRDLRLTRAGWRYGRTVRAEPAAEQQKPSELEQRWDAITEGPGVWKWRHYFPIYERHLARFVGQSPVVVEVGVFSGGSLPMWADYFGPGTEMVGVDIDPRCAAYATNGVRVFVGDQSDPAFWDRLLGEVGPVDVLIDDGAHLAGCQIATMEAVLPRLKPGGVWFCEDVMLEATRLMPYLSGLALNLHTHDDPPSAFQQAVGSIHLYPYVAVIERRDTELVFSSEKHGTEWAPPEHVGQF